MLIKCYLNLFTYFGWPLLVNYYEYLLFIVYILSIKGFQENNIELKQIHGKIKLYEIFHKIRNGNQNLIVEYVQILLKIWTKMGNKNNIWNTL